MTDYFPIILGYTAGALTLGILISAIWALAARIVGSVRKPSKTLPYAGESSRKLYKMYGP